MPTETLYPNGVTNTGDYSVVLTDVDEAPNGAWTGNTRTQGIVALFDFPTPSGDPNTGAGLQTFRAYAQIVGTGNGSPTIQIELYESGSLVTSQTAQTVLSTDPAGWYSLTWDAADLTTASGVDVQVRVSIATGGGGPNENSLQLDSVEWVADVAGPVSLTAPVGAATATGYTPANIKVGRTVSANVGAASFTGYTPTIDVIPFDPTDGNPKYVEITIDNTQVDATLTDFPVYVNLDDLPAAFWSSVKSDGGDIRITDSGVTKRLPVEIVSINTGTTVGQLHFKADSISSSADTVFRLYYGDGTLTAASVTDPYGRNAVWSDYIGVWHMEEDPSGTAPQIVDSTGTYPGTSAGTMTSGDVVTGKMGNALDFDDTDDYIDIGTWSSTKSITAGFTIQAWIQGGPISTGKMVMAPDDTSGGGERVFQFRRGGDDNSAAIQLLRFDSASAYLTGAFGTTALTGTTTWYLVHGTFDDAVGTKVYVNGVEDDSDTILTANNEIAGPAYIAARTSSAVTDFFDAGMDEVRFRNSGLSAAWIDAEHTNQNTPTTFYTIGTEQTVGTGTTVTANVGAATAAGYTPTVLTPRSITANLGTATAAGFTPTVTASDNQTVVAQLGTGTFAGQTPASVTTSDNQVVAANLGTATIAGLTPANIATPRSVTANAGAVTATGYTPTVSTTRTITANVGAATATGYTPTVLAPRTVTANVGAATATGFTPTILTPRSITANLGTGTWAGYTPTIAVSDNKTVAANAGAATATGFTPANIVTPRSVTANLGTATFAGFSPTISTGDAKVVTAPVGAATATGYTPTIATPRTVTANVGTATASGLTPTVSTSASLSITSNLGTGTFAGLTPTIAVSDNQTVAANAGASTASGLTPTVTASDNQAVTANVGTATATGFTPTVIEGANQAVTAPVGTASITGFTHTIAVTDNKVVAANVGAGTWSGLTPTIAVASGVLVVANAGTASFTGFSPVIGVPLVLTPTVGSAVWAGPVPVVATYKVGSPFTGQSRKMYAPGSTATNMVAPKTDTVMKAPKEGGTQ